VSSKRSGCGAANWRNWFEQQIEIRFAQSIARYTPRADPADLGEIVARRGSQSFRSSNSLQATAENGRGQTSVRVEEIGLGGSRELVRVNPDFKRIRKSLCRCPDAGWAEQENHRHGRELVSARSFPGAKPLSCAVVASVPRLAEAEAG